METKPEVVTPEDVAHLSKRADELAASDPHLSELLHRVLRERGRTRVAGRALIEALPGELMALPATQTLFSLLAPWPTCSVRRDDAA